MSADPRPTGAGAGAGEAGAPAANEDLEEGPADLEAAGDVEGLLARARAYRAGSPPFPRDLRKCFEAYAAAARLGSADAEYAVALFLVNGGPVPQDLKEGATRLRAAAERGSVPAKVFLGNMYELGIHYRADPEKADVWYRNAARSAGVSDAPGTDAHTRELAELGCARHALAVAERGGADEDTKARLLGRARAHGYGLRVKTDEAAAPEPTAGATDAPTRATRDASAMVGALTEAEASDVVVPERAEGRGHLKKSRGAAPENREAGGRGHVSNALAAFGYALLFLLAGVGAAYAAWHGARELVAHGTPLPLFGTRTDQVFPAVLGLIGVLPSLLVYRLGTFVKAVLAAGVMAGVGWISWGTGQAVLHAARPVQALAFALPGFVAALLVLGLVDGVKLGAARARRR
jgi:hypothetical protein